MKQKINQLDVKKYFCKKIRFVCEVHSDLKDKDFCVLGIYESAIAIVEWDKRGEYNFDFYTLKSLGDIKIIEFS
ncbi:MAG: hypothetical protein JKY28_05275 [Sulfurimonas sp.]|nr:hypothetical protein [Sulfurimonas sp.]PHQ88497.1 MAG: hypothetical protein COB42_08730 [Sulfurimonas sp.]PHQ89535.1 MAG: hypothetical protein COB42_06840 [Sulfurimonas sp.]